VSRAERVLIRLSGGLGSAGHAKPYALTPVLLDRGRQLRCGHGIIRTAVVSRIGAARLGACKCRSGRVIRRCILLRTQQRHGESQALEHVCDRLATRDGGVGGSGVPIRVVGDHPPADDRDDRDDDRDDRDDRDDQ
jgi:hypothetical protein